MRKLSILPTDVLEKRRNQLERDIELIDRSYSCRFNESIMYEEQLSKRPDDRAIREYLRRCLKYAHTTMKNQRLAQDRARRALRQVNIELRKRILRDQ